MKNNKIYKIIPIIIAIIPLIIAYLTEYIGQVEPCELCVYQRIPYWIALLFSIIYYKNPKNLWISFIISIYIISAGLAFYHMGVEEGLWNSACAVSIPQDGSIEAMRALIKTSDKADCTNTYKLLNVSLSSLNLIYSTIALIIHIIYIKIKRRNNY